MSWHDDLIATYEKLVADLRRDIELMEQGTFEMRSRNPDGSWTVLNDGIIVRDRQTIKELQAIIEAARASKAQDNRE